MISIDNGDYAIHFGEQGYSVLNEFLSAQSPSVLFILVDENTMQHCYPILMPQLETDARIEIIEIESGEEHKTIDTCVGIWNALVELECDRNSLIINLGGGVITDIGGFIASTMKRGLDFIHVPTSLLGMVDAAIGGKNGVDLGALKNQIGVINPPVMTIVDPFYLRSLPTRELVSGSIEMFKHGLIADRAYWHNMLAVVDYHDSTFESLIYQSIIIKNDIVQSDPLEKNERKALNYGHTIGHAIESYCMTSDEHPTLLHGEAIAAGLLAESYISLKQTGLNTTAYNDIKTWYWSLKLKLNFTAVDIENILELMKHDKKNVNGENRFVLLESIGSFITNQPAPAQLVREAMMELDY